MIRALPNALTLCNLIAGCCAIAALFEGMFKITLFLAVLCLVFDLLDGILARRLNASSALGVQLDSLADLVSFGVLPGCIVYLLLSDECSGTITSALLPYSAFLIPAGVALRLARFNLDTRDRTVFFGLPTPSAAILIFGFLWMYMEAHPWWVFLCEPVILYIVVLLLPFLMLSNLRLWSTKGLQHMYGKGILASFLLAFALLLLLTGSAGVSLIVIIYVLFGIINYYIKLY